MTAEAGDAPSLPESSIGAGLQGPEALSAKTFGPQAVGRQQEFQLHASDPVVLKTRLDGDYLQVMISLTGTSAVKEVTLVMAELTWKAG